MEFFTEHFTTEREQWREVQIFGIVQQRYKVSDMGKVYDMEKSRFLEYSVDAKNGFMSVGLRKRNGTYKKFLLHRLVFEVFHPEAFAEAVSNKWQILHKDGNVRKNELSNLMAAPREIVRKQRTQEISRLRK